MELNFSLSYFESGLHWHGASLSTKPSKNCKRILYIYIYISSSNLCKSGNSSVNKWLYFTKKEQTCGETEYSIDEVSQFSLEHSRNSVNIGEKKNLYFAAAGAQTQCSKRLGPVAGGHDYLA